MSTRDFPERTGDLLRIGRSANSGQILAVDVPRRRPPQTIRTCSD